MLGKRSTENLLSDQLAHLRAEGELNSSSSAAGAMPASPMRFSSTDAISGESFT